MSPKSLFARPNVRRATRPRHRESGFAAAGMDLAQRAWSRAGELGRCIPVPAVLARRISKADATFIALAYAIPLPGTGLAAAAIVGGKIGCRHLRGRLKRRSIAAARG